MRRNVFHLAPIESTMIVEQNVKTNRVSIVWIKHAFHIIINLARVREEQKAYTRQYWGIFIEIPLELKLKQNGSSSTEESKLFWHGMCVCEWRVDFFHHFFSVQLVYVLDSSVLLRETCPLFFVLFRHFFFVLNRWFPYYYFEWSFLIDVSDFMKCNRESGTDDVEPGTRNQEKGIETIVGGYDLPAAERIWILSSFFLFVSIFIFWNGTHLCCWFCANFPEYLIIKYLLTRV